MLSWNLYLQLFRPGFVYSAVYRVWEGESIHSGRVVVVDKSCIDAVPLPRLCASPVSNSLLDLCINPSSWFDLESGYGAVDVPMPMNELCPKIRRNLPES